MTRAQAATFLPTVFRCRRRRRRGRQRRQECSVEKPPAQDRKGATARLWGLSALPSLALMDVDRLLAFFTSFPLIPRFCLYIVAAELYSGTPSALRCFADDRMRANTKRYYYTEWRGNLPCRLRPIPASNVQVPPVGHPIADSAGIRLTAAAFPDLIYAGRLAVTRSYPLLAGLSRQPVASWFVC